MIVVTHVETTFVEDAKRTLMTLHMTLPDRDARNQMLTNGMERGMQASYARLEAMTPGGVERSRAVPQ